MCDTQFAFYIQPHTLGCLAEWLMPITMVWVVTTRFNGLLLSLSLSHRNPCRKCQRAVCGVGGNIKVCVFVRIPRMWWVWSMVRVFFSLCLPDKHSGEVQRNRLRKSCPQGMVGVSIFKLSYYLNSHYIVNFKWPIKRQKYTTYFISLQI